MGRISRSVIGVVVTAAAVGIAVSAPAYAAAPTAPHTALVLDGRMGSDVLRGVLVLDEANAELQAYADGSILSLIGTKGQGWSSVSAIPPSGDTWEVGRSYPVAHGIVPGHALFTVGVEHRSCQVKSGTLTVREVAWDPQTADVTTFAASFFVECTTTPDVLAGEIRFSSTVDYVASVRNVATLNLGQQPVGFTGTPSTVTLTAQGSTPTALTATTVEGDAAAMFTVAADTCAGSILAFGQTCTVTVTPTATALGAHSAHLVLGDNTTIGTHLVPLTLTGVDPRGVSPSTRSLSFGSRPAGYDSPPMSVTLTATGPYAVTFGTAGITGPNSDAFRITADTCSGTTRSPGQTCAISVVPRPTALTEQTGTLSIPTNGLIAPSVSLTTDGKIGPAGTYHVLRPSRILDTRSGNGAPARAVGPQSVTTLQVTGRGGVPTANVGAVVLNVTVTSPTASASFLTVYPAGQTRPTASSINFSRDWTRANLVTVAVGASGRVNLFNNAGSTHVIADVVGYYLADNAGLTVSRGGELQPTIPQRLVDTRVDGDRTVLPRGYIIEIPVSYGATWDSHIRALALNITAVTPRAAGHLVAWNGDGSLPTTSSLNYTAGSVVPNMAVVPTRVCRDCGPSPVPSVTIYTTQDTHLVVDIVGFYDDGTMPDGLRFRAMTPTRVADTRIGQGLPRALGPGATGTVAVPAGLLSGGTQALALNLTAVAPTATTNLIVWPAGAARPVASNLNPGKGQTVANGALTLLGGGAFQVYNNAGTTPLVIDVVGVFHPYPTMDGTVSAAKSLGGHRLATQPLSDTPRALSPPVRQP